MYFIASPFRRNNVSGITPLAEFEDGKLTFSVVRKFIDNEIPIDYVLTIDGDKLSGKGSAEFEGQKQECDITGTREKKSK